MKVPKKISLILISFLGLALPLEILARIGVGVGLGKIQVDKPLKAGMVYDLPSLPVINTGDEPGEYGVSIEYHKGQEENPEMGLKPAKEWFRFEPSTFYLEPGQIQQVKITLVLPMKTVPGNYFVYLEGHPVKKATSGQTRVGVAAATKLYFTVVPANIFQGIYYRFVSLYSRYHPLDTIVLVLIALIVLIKLISKRFKIQIARK
ncbi:MAG: hypothetical protein ACP5PR_02110 [Minisyncoccia bacterium]